MATSIKLVQGDTRPFIRVCVMDSQTGLAIDLSGCTVKMYFRGAEATSLQATLVGLLLPGKRLPDGAVSTEAPFDVPGSGGLTLFTFASGDLDCEEGGYMGEVEVTYRDGTKHTIYDTLPFLLREDFADSMVP